MQARRLLPLAAALPALALTASPALGQQVRLTIADSGKTVTVRQGDTLAISLASNQTTPYHWVVTQRPARAVARVTSARYVQPTNGMAGAGGTQRYTLKATGRGTTRFATQYQELSTGAVGSGPSTFAVRIRVR